MSRIRKDTETPVDWPVPEPAPQGPTCAHCHRPAVSLLGGEKLCHACWRGCDHVRFGQQQPCAKCATAIAATIEKFRGFMARIEARTESRR